MGPEPAKNRGFMYIWVISVSDKAVILTISSGS